ncbi:MAG: hypothetical protein MUO61_03505 [Dehalococcoidia bacterium]|nr:hypothetical protein [Dehalococcoidia bacterium]
MGITAAKAAYGTVLNWDGVDIAEVSNISGPTLSIDTIDATHYTSPSAFKEFIAGFGDAGEVTFECNFIGSDTLGQQAFIVDAYAKSVKAVVITLASPIVATWTFNGIVTKLDFAQPMDNKLSFSATIKISGVPTLAVNTSLGLTTLVLTANGGVKVMTPVFANATYLYSCVVLTTETWIKFTATQLTNPHTIQVRINGGAWTALSSGVISGQITIGIADTVTLAEVNCYEVGKISKTYIIYIVCPAP